jgi:hypothetical protein
LLGTTPLGFARSWPRWRTRRSGDSTLTQDLPPKDTLSGLKIYSTIAQVCIRRKQCQTPDQVSTSLVLHFKFFGPSTWVQIPVYCLYYPSNTNVIFDGVSIHNSLGSFPLLLLRVLLTVHIWRCTFAYWALPISRCDDIILFPTTFGDVHYVPRVGSFIEDTSAYCDATSQHLVHSDIREPITTCSHGGTMCLLAFFDGASSHKYT